MIRRTNPWIGGSNADASPDQTTPTGRWVVAANETGEAGDNIITTTTTTTRPFRNSVARFVDEESNVLSSSSVAHSAGDDSLLTTSMDTDSLFQSEISDNEATRTSQRLDWNSAPNDNERPTTNDVTSCADSSPVVVEESDVSSPPRSGLRLPLFGRHKDTVTDCEGNRLSTEAVDNSEEKNRKRLLRRSPESNSDWKRRSSNAEDEGRISELSVPRCDIRTTKAATAPDKIRDNDVDETQTKPTCRQRRRLLIESGGERETCFVERCDDDQFLFTASDQLRLKILAIRSSLQDKVTLLKHEKKVVDRKIREAKEEERLRLRQLEIFRQQLSERRKELLLRTLEEVKKQLSQQVLRLQNVYDVVLVEQRQLVCCY